MTIDRRTTAIEVAGLTLMLGALITLAVVCGTWSWQAGALVAAIELAAIGALLVVLASARERRV